MCLPHSKEAGPAPCWPVSLRSFNIDPQPCTWLREEDKGDAGEAGTSQGKGGGRRSRVAAAEHDADESDEEDMPRTNAKKLAKKARVSLFCRCMQQVLDSAAAHAIAISEASKHAERRWTPCGSSSSGHRSLQRVQVRQDRVLPMQLRNQRQAEAGTWPRSAGRP